MKKILFFSTMLLASISSFSQGVAINTSNAIPDSSAILDISSYTKGVLIPRLRTSERESISGPAEGLLVYDINTYSFWFFTLGAWKEILKEGAPILPIGPAGGDLSGSYPTPSVVKIQNLDVSADFPFDKTVLKWDALSNNWKGRSDSLFLPYNATYGHPTNLFGVTNANTTGGSSAVFGRSSLAGSGITPANTSGVWGDNSAGAGVVGTSNTGQGVFGFSFNNNAIQGYSVLGGTAGIYGSHANDNGIGVMGEIQSNAIGIYGKATGDHGNAAVFASTSSSHLDTTLAVSTAGLGILSAYSITNTSSVKPALDIIHEGNGNGIKIRLNKSGGAANALDILSQGSGIGVYSKTLNGIAGKFETSNASNSYPVLMVDNQGFGSSMYVTSTQTGLTGPAMDIFSLGSGGGVNVLAARGKAGVFTTSEPTAFEENLIVTTEADAPNALFNANHPESFETNLVVNQNGKGKGIEINLTQASNLRAGLYVNTLGNKGAEVISAGLFGVTASATANGAIAINGNTGQTANNAVGVRGTTGANVTNGIGVLGQAGVNDPNGIGVKGVAGGNNDGGIGVLGEATATNPMAIGVKGIGHSHNEDVGAITGINMTDGVGVLGESLGLDGIGVVGIVGNTSNHSVAAMFKNNYTNNNRAVVEIQTNGKGNGIYLDHDQLGNTAPLFRMRNAGTGQFLRLEDGLGDIKTTLSKEGNLTTDGTITVKGDKGIVRNSSSTQLRMEIVTANIPAGQVNHFDEFNSPDYIDIDFGTSFGSAPAVSLGNVVTGGIGLLTLTIEDVTTTGCTIVLWNYTGHDWPYPATSYKLIVVGVE